MRQQVVLKEHRVPEAGEYGECEMTYRLLDLFCKAGGCTRGYQQAGFVVTGVDIEPQPNYVGDEFIQADALEYFRGLIDSGDIEMFAAIHSSPPCQAYSMSSQQWRKSGKEYPDLVEPTRKLLIESGKPYIIENVPGAPLINPIVLNGPMFGMKLRRRRMFETSFNIPFFILPSEEKSNFRMGRPVKEGDVITPVGHFSNVGYARRVMGIQWMTGKELSQAIPPAYTEFIGKHLMDYLEALL